MKAWTSFSAFREVRGLALAWQAQMQCRRWKEDLGYVVDDVGFKWQLIVKYNFKVVQLNRMRKLNGTNGGTEFLFVSLLFLTISPPFPPPDPSPALGHSRSGALQEPHPQLHPRLCRRRRCLRHHKWVETCTHYTPHTKTQGGRSPTSLDYCVTGRNFHKTHTPNVCTSRDFTTWTLLPYCSRATLKCTRRPWHIGHLFGCWQILGHRWTSLALELCDSPCWPLSLLFDLGFYWISDEGRSS